MGARKRTHYFALGKFQDGVHGINSPQVGVRGPGYLGLGKFLDGAQGVDGPLPALVAHLLERLACKRRLKIGALWSIGVQRV